MQNEFKHIVAILEENPDLSSVERLVWDLEKIKDKIETLGHKLNIINIFKFYPKCFEIY